jgi:hypothetical protein
VFKGWNGVEEEVGGVGYIGGAKEGFGYNK